MLLYVPVLHFFIAVYYDIIDQHHTFLIFPFSQCFAYFEKSYHEYSYTLPFLCEYMHSLIFVYTYKLNCCHWNYMQFNFIRNYPTSLKCSCTILYSQIYESPFVLLPFNTWYIQAILV